VAIEEGEQLGPYRVLGPIARGGMGAVYRAHDPRLGREVAVKVLRDECAGDSERLRRFELEARAASAIDHPNILTVHDVGTHAGSPYLVTELLKGETLRGRLARGPLPSDTTLVLATQIAEGLAAAHGRGIVHRDLKPANVFLTDAGGVKIVDFGIAKLVVPEDDGAPADAASETVTESLALLGTPNYIAPEQVDGARVDFRADQFALGCILYEMLTGTRPFARESVGRTLAAVAAEEPPPLSERAPEVPLPLVWLVERCLSKDPEGRYAATVDLARDLSTLRDRGEELRGPAPARPRRRARGPWPVAAAIVALLAAVALWRGWPSAPTEVPELQALTYSGRDTSPTTSRDGRTVAFSSERDGRRRIWLKDFSTGAEVPLTEGPSDDFPRFSPDGSQLLFVRQTGRGSDLYRMPTVGGEPRLVVEDARGGDWLPSGDAVAFVRWDVEGGLTRTLLCRAGADGSAAEVVTRFEGVLMHQPRVSPDGRQVALSDAGLQAGMPVAVWLVDLQRGEAAPLPGRPEIGPLSSSAWLGSGDALVYGRAESVSGQLVASPSRVFVHPIRSSSPQVVLSLRTFPMTLDVAGTGKLVLDGRTSRQNLREVSGDGAPGGDRWLTRGNSGDRQPAYSPDGEWVAFSARRGGSLDLWAVSTGSGEVRQLTDDISEDWDPAFMQDGRLLWSSNRSGGFEIWIAASDGSSPRQVTLGTGDAQNPTATPDADWIVYGSGSLEQPGIFKVRPDGSERTPLSRGTALLPEVSPDGRYVSYLSNWGTAVATLRVLRLADSAHEPFAVELPYDPNPRSVVLGRSRWLPDGSGLAFVSQAEDGSFGVFALPFEPGHPATGPPRRLAGFDRDLLTESFDIAPDGEKITLAQWEPVSTLILAENVPRIEPIRR